MVHAVDREFRTVMVLLRRFLKVAECLIGVLFHSRSGQINAPQLEKGMSVMLLRRFFIALDGLLIVGVRGLFTGKQKICFRNPVLRRFFFFHWWNGWSLRIFFRYGRRLLRRQWRVYRWLDMWRGSFAGRCIRCNSILIGFCSAGSDQIPYDAAKNDQGNSGYYPLCLERRMPAVRGRRRRQLAA
ncbi:MAG: hypothetical protein E7K26_09510 [Akkermansia sp.]|uniref:hypothetical protein n=1 Tax=Akkermansia sp. TaxID=1872421 RepID=UPI002044CF97|nr:hypothetical protein [Akkermansia sp.]MDU7625914.1 hypothetical protein [Akkermansia sp.]